MRIVQHFVSDSLHHTNIIYAADIDKLLFRNVLLPFATRAGTLGVFLKGVRIYGRYGDVSRSFEHYMCNDVI